ncbi:hypothetical protein chiPu_0002927 [Chiloscyllium punctatum]|uniref:Uncharacterized protein n=1 Tax=Chiloscyllium punctatum TaxID=137246 RepID=A0A401S2C4_CHIPU|nr:hypothetical protein [Chiloscyllium punctatum]
MVVFHLDHMSQPIESLSSQENTYWQRLYVQSGKSNSGRSERNPGLQVTGLSRFNFKDIKRLQMLKKELI